MGPDAALGPLDAQIFDPEAETYSSVLNEVHALERLRAYGMESILETMALLLQSSGKRIDTLLPHVLRFAADTMRPLLEKIDIIHYNERARTLKVAEEYAVRLLRFKHPEPENHFRRDEAKEIALRLVENYPEHGFHIDQDEARSIGLDIAQVSKERAIILDDLWAHIQGITAIGLLTEGEPNDDQGELAPTRDQGTGTEAPES